MHSELINKNLIYPQKNNRPKSVKQCSSNLLSALLNASSKNFSGPFSIVLILSSFFRAFTFKLLLMVKFDLSCHIFDAILAIGQLQNLIIPVVPCFIVGTFKVECTVLLLCLQKSFLETCSADENSQRNLLFHPRRKEIVLTWSRTMEKHRVGSNASFVRCFTWRFINGILL